MTTATEALKTELATLKPLAEAATPGPWIAGNDEDSDYYLIGPEAYPGLVTAPVVRLHSERDALYLAAANPATILKLIAAIEAPTSEPVGQVVACEDYGKTIRWAAKAPAVGAMLYDHAAPVAAPTEPVAQSAVAGEPSGDVDLDAFDYPKAMLKREDWDTTTRKPKIEPAKSAEPAPVEPAGAAVDERARALEALMGEYWDIAYREGCEGVNLSAKASDVLVRFHAKLAQQAAAPEVAVPEGWQLVPTRVTYKMKRAGGAFQRCPPWVVYEAMLAAAPTSPGEPA